jgi:hypothetical protein
LADFLVRHSAAFPPERHMYVVHNSAAFLAGASSVCTAWRPNPAGVSPACDFKGRQSRTREG